MPAENVLTLTWAFADIQENNMAVKNIHPKENCEIHECKDKGCPKRHPKSCRYLGECRIQSNCSYSHKKEVVAIHDEETGLLENISNFKAEICTLTNENNDRINILAKVHPKDLLVMKEKNNDLENRIYDL